MSEAARDTLRCMVLPLAGQGLLVPSAAVAEVIVVTALDAAATGPAWLAGFTSWRGVRIPLLDAAPALGLDTAPAAARRRAAVLHALEQRQEMPYYGILIERLPTVVLASQDSAVAVPAPAPAAWIEAQLRLAVGVVLVPRLDALETMLREALV